MGPADGRLIVRSQPEAEPERILVLRTLGAPQRRFLANRRGRRLTESDAEPVPTSRVTLIDPESFASSGAAESWLAGLRHEPEQARAKVAEALGVLCRALHAHRAAHADPYAWDVPGDAALVSRVGFGSGDAVAEGRYADALELPRSRDRTKRSMEAPEERFAALLGARESVLACEDLVLRARADLDAGRERQAALQARVALESLLAEMGEEIRGDRRGHLEADRGPVGEAANAALRGDLTREDARELGEAITRMEAALRVRRLGSAS